MEVNQDVVTGYTPPSLDGAYNSYIPPQATPACLSQAKQALWTNRVPLHEPWPRVLKCDGPIPPNAMTDEYKKNVRHVDQYDNVTSPEGLQPIGRVEGDETIDRLEFWRR